jgi:NitT/TauT family transport system ATP-binding protein
MTASEAPAIAISRVSKIFHKSDGSGAHRALSDVTLDIPRGRFVCLLGPSGCGKSTLLNMVAGLYQPSTGSITYHGQPVSSVNTKVGYITQGDTLLPWRNLERNVGLSLELASRRDRKASASRVAAMLRTVGLAGFEKHYPNQLSGGMRKRAILARTLLYDPETLLMDEPFGALDAQLRATLQIELLRLWNQDRKTVLFVTHDLEEAIMLADDIVVFGTNPGRVIHVEQVNLPRPRDAVSLRGSAEFGELWARLWRLLRAETVDQTVAEA